MAKRKMRPDQDLWRDFNETFPQRQEEKIGFARQKAMFEAIMDIREMFLLLLDSGHIVARDSIPSFIKNAIE